MKLTGYNHLVADAFFVEKADHHHVQSVLTEAHEDEINDAIRDLKNVRWRLIVVDYYGLDGLPARTFSEIGDRYELSREPIRTARNGALKQMLDYGPVFFEIAAALLEAGADCWRARRLIERGLDRTTFAQIERLRQLVIEESPELPVVKQACQHVSIDVLRVDTRTKLCLRNDDICTLEQLEQRTYAELLRTPNFGTKSAKKLVAAMAEIGFALQPNQRESV